MFKTCKRHIANLLLIIYTHKEKSCSYCFTIGCVHLPVPIFTFVCASGLLKHMANFDVRVFLAFTKNLCNDLCYSIAVPNMQTQLTGFQKPNSSPTLKGLCRFIWVHCYHTVSVFGFEILIRVCGLLIWWIQLILPSFQCRLCPQCRSANLI
jgi:hypothetical protein